MFLFQHQKESAGCAQKEILFTKGTPWSKDNVLPHGDKQNSSETKSLINGGRHPSWDRRAYDQTL